MNPSTNYKEATVKVIKEKLPYFLIGLSVLLIVIVAGLALLQQRQSRKANSVAIDTNKQLTVSEEITKKQEKQRKEEILYKEAVGKQQTLAIIKGQALTATSIPTAGPRPTNTVTPTMTPSVTPRPTVTNKPTVTMKPTASIKPTLTKTPAATITALPTITISPTSKPQPTVMVTPKSGDKTYTVQSGDYLWAIAEKYYGDGFKAYDIAKANNISQPSYIYKGTILKLPKVSATPTIAQTQENGQISATHTEKVTQTRDWYIVKSGDNLWDIAIASYGDGFLWTKIANANNIANPRMLYVGTKLIIPRN